MDYLLQNITRQTKEQPKQPTKPNHRAYREIMGPAIKRLTRLSEKEKENLINNFKKLRTKLNCPECDQTNTLYLNGTTHDTTRHLRFVCKLCKKQPNHDKIYAAITNCNKQRTPVPTDLEVSEPEPHPTPEPAGGSFNDSESYHFDSLPTDWADQMAAEENQANTQRSNTLQPLVFEHHHEVPAFMNTIIQELNTLRSQVQHQDNIIHELKTITDRLTKVTEELNQANSRVTELEKENNRLRAQIDNPTPNGTAASIYAHEYNHTSNQNTSTQRSTTSTNPWSQPDRVRKLRQRSQPSAATIKRRQQAAARCFQPLSETHGFAYTYFFSKVRFRTGAIRAKLRKFGVDNSRVLDIHYPDHQVVALLTHNDYVDELKDAMAAQNILPKDQFNPCDPTRLRDPKYKDDDEHKRKETATKLHHVRMLRAVQYIRFPVCLAVARDFHRKQLLTETQYQEIIKQHSRQHTTQTQSLEDADNFKQPESTTNNSSQKNIDTEMADAATTTSDLGSLGSGASPRL